MTSPRAWRGTRRAVLLGTAGAVTACSPARSTSSTGPATPAPAAATAVSGPAPQRRPPWPRLARHVEGRLTLPGDSSYDTVRLLQNPRFDGARPLAVLTVASAADVATAFAFAHDHALPVAVRSGGHCYAGWSAGGSPRALVVDCRALDRVSFAGTTATIGPGARLLPVYRAVGGRGRAIAGGSCATVGFGGLTLGGGVGVLTRAMGLTCDAVTRLQVVTADGRTLTASPDSEPDLYWALRGGGGGHVGVVTAFDVATRPAPDLSTAYLQWPLSAAVDVVPAWLGWAPDADARLWSTLKALGGAAHPDGPVLLLSATWTGPDRAFARQLAGLLDHVPAPAVDVAHRRTYLEAMTAYAGDPDAPRESFGATSHIAYDPLDAGGVDDLVHQVRTAQGSGLKEAGLSIDALGGRVRDLAPGDTAFVHRDALATVQYTATYAHGRPAEADRFVRRFRDAMTPHWGEHAYVNYADPSLPDPDAAYFGANAARLAGVRRAYDPDGFFSQPQDW